MPAGTKKTKSASVSDTSDALNLVDLDAERSVLAAAMINPDIADEICVMLTPDNFGRSDHRVIFSAIFDLVNQGQKPDSVSVSDKLNVENKLDAAGDRIYINDLCTRTQALVSWRQHAEIVKRFSIQRDLVKVAAEINGIAFNGPDNVSELVGQAESALFNVTEKRVSSNFIEFADAGNMFLEELDFQRKHRNENEVIGVPTGLTDVDKKIGGFRPGDLIVLAARPGVGKTSLALNMAVNAAEKGVKVAFFSLEMSTSQLVQRIISSKAGVDLSVIKDARVQDAEMDSLRRACIELGNWDISIDDTADLSILEARAKGRRVMRDVKKENKKGLIVVDYLQLLKAPVQRRDGNRAAEVGEISRGLKVLAKELGVPILALSQLNRSVETRTQGSKAPMLSDLRESGSIEQDADIVMFIDRSMNEEEAEKPGRPPLGTARLIIEKHRNGSTGSIDLSFRPENTKFDNLAKTEYAGYE